MTLLRASPSCAAQPWIAVSTIVVSANSGVGKATRTWSVPAVQRKLALSGKVGDRFFHRVGVEEDALTGLQPLLAHE